MIGDGDVDFSAIFHVLRDMDSRVPLVIEMWAQDDNWRDNILSAQKHLNQAAVDADFPLYLSPQSDLIVGKKNPAAKVAPDSLFLSA
ncbi:putative hexulose-6-phosphate isomerase SgbU domain protein [Yersinia ruckeri]|uniref:hypothetical protein n=1 Tax=Yersinia ruckeri TaxID=29486 RepID=UPI0005AD2E43|nr:hypothetical protein [Yersinia ruckeri]AJI95120.1 putative hexulose-6-phosphate isomerase SgbU domain protein [Yersinia ruckeri]